MYSLTGEDVEGWPNWCGCNSANQCNSCCGDASGSYKKVFDSNFGAGLDPWNIETHDPDGDAASRYVNDGSTLQVDNGKLRIRVRDMVPNVARFHQAPLVVDHL